MWVSQSLALELLEEMRTRTFVMSPAVIRGKDKAENSAFFSVFIYSTIVQLVLFLLLKKTSVSLSYRHAFPGTDTLSMIAR